MSSSSASRFKSPAELRKFGLVMFCALAVVTAILWWRKGLGAPVYGCGGVAIAFAVTGLVLPRVLAPIEWAWMKLAAGMGFVMTRVILTLTFYLAITPVGLVMRLTRYDPLQLRRRKVDTYWVPVDPEGPGSRTSTPF